MIFQLNMKNICASYTQCSVFKHDSDYGNGNVVVMPKYGDKTHLWLKNEVHKKKAHCFTMMGVSQIWDFPLFTYT